MPEGSQQSTQPFFGKSVIAEQVNLPSIQRLRLG